jgi:DNA (cytosine-5)-methyltransferase 1
MNYYNEYDEGAANWLEELIRQNLIPAGVVDRRDMRDVTPDDLQVYNQCHFFAGIGGWAYALRLAGVPEDFPLWTGSPPCQPFSTAGLQKGKNDERHLAPHFINLVRACCPSLLFGEQVASADVFGKSSSASGKRVEGAPQWAWLDDLFDRLEAARYAAWASDIPAAGVGAPNIRQRTFFGAVRVADSDHARFSRLLQSVHVHAAEGRGVAERCSDKSYLAPPIWGDKLHAHTGADGRVRPRLFESLSDTDGLSARVVRVRGYGNAINPWAAKEFIEASIEVVGRTGLGALTVNNCH